MKGREGLRIVITNYIAELKNSQFALKNAFEAKKTDRHVFRRTKELFKEGAGTGFVPALENSAAILL